jgi:hypothetical protein
MAETIDYNGKQYVVSDTGGVYQSGAMGPSAVNEDLKKIILQMQAISRNAAAVGVGDAFPTFSPPSPPAQPNLGSGGSGGGGGSNAPSKANNAGATLPANSEKIDIRISDEILEEVTRLTLDIMQDSADLIPFDLSFNSIDFIPEREVFSADNETRYGIYFEDTETDQFVDVRNTESEDISLGIIRTKITDLNKARRNGTRRYFDAFTVKYDSNGTPEISLKIDTGTTGIDGLDVIILQIKDNIESFTRQDPPS